MRTSPCTLTMSRERGYAPTRLTTLLQHRRVALTLPLLAALWASQSVALNIVLTDVSAMPMSADQLAAFEEAADRWESVYGDPITVNINVAFNDLAANILGSTSTARTSPTYSDLLAALNVDSDSISEDAAVAALPAASVPLLDINGARSDTAVTISTANAKALGLGTGTDATYPNPPNGVDAAITFNTDFSASFDYDPSDGIGPSQTDFVAVAKHEIGHALGFFSVTDVQDGNPTFTLHANSLDLWRFDETGGAHVIPTEDRRLTAGAAEYYDSILGPVPFSHGSSVVDPLCNSSTGACQASHWSDDQGNLLDPTIATSVSVDLQSDDRHSLDYVGYDAQTPICLRCLVIREICVRWWWEFDGPPFCEGFPFPRGPFPDPPPWATYGATFGIDIPEIGRRGGLGYARFVDRMPIDPHPIEPEKDIPGEMNLLPPGEIAREKPASLYEFTFDSDDEAGKAFHFESTCGAAGCEYDPTLGDFGGYRVPGTLDAAGDGQEPGDVDGRITMLLLADESGVPDPDRQNQFKIDPGMGDNAVIIEDYAAFGLEPPADDDRDEVPNGLDNCLNAVNLDQRDTDGDGIGNACDADIAQPNDCTVNFLDLSVVKAAFFSTPADGAWNPDADFDGDGAVNFTDLALVKAGFFAAPGPSGTPNACAD